MSSPAQKRILKDYQTFEKEPLDGVSIFPHDDNLYLCDCYIEISSKDKSVSSHLPMLVHFSAEYPLKAPDVGFPIDFGYTQGASYFKSDGILKGMLVICLDILGNFANVHDEWAGVKGSGWSPSYTLTSLLVNMQTVIADAFNEKSTMHVRNVVRQCEEYKRKNSVVIEQRPSKKSPAASTTGSDDGKSDGELCDIQRMDVLSEELAAALQLVAREVSDDAGQLAATASIARFLVNKHQTIAQQQQTAAAVDEIDPEIFCWFSTATYREDILGYGVQVQRQGRNSVLSTDGNYISYSAFSESKLRQYPNKDTFQHFLPAWIDPQHSRQNAQWSSVLRQSLQAIAKDLQLNGGMEEAIIRVYADLLNTMVVQMMDNRSDVRASSLIFRCLLNLWRSLHHLCSAMPNVKQRIVQQLRRFVANGDRQQRLKSSVPNLGNVLALTLALDEQDLPWASFLQAFEEECGLRRVLWWQRDGATDTRAPGSSLSRNTFAQCSISRNNVLFQVLLRSKLLERPLAQRVDELDQLRCNLHSGVESLLEAWKEVSARMERGAGWQQYYQELAHMGFPEMTQQRICRDVDTHIRELISQAGKLQGYSQDAAGSRGYNNNNGNNNKGYNNNNYNNRNNNNRHGYK